MFEAPPSPYLVPKEGGFRAASAATAPPQDVASKKQLRKALGKSIDKLDHLQRVLYAHHRHAVLLVFQAMDAAGKDGTIRAVMSGVNPAGCQVYSFKAPSAMELDHDFLWRTTTRLSERGRIGIFNRSYYEEVLVVRVHPEFLAAQRLPRPIEEPRLWEERLASIQDHELHLARNGTVILKFWLNVSREEQRKRLLARLDDPSKNWKFSERDIEERGFWDRYIEAYEHALNATSTTWAPWYAIPADNKAFMRCQVADILVRALSGLDLQYPEMAEDEKRRLDEMRARLEDE